MRPSAEDRQTTSVGKPVMPVVPRSAPPSSLASVVTPAPECAPRHAHFGLWPGANPEISGTADRGVGDGVVAHAPASRSRERRGGCGKPEPVVSWLTAL